MRDFLEAINHPRDAFLRQNRLLAWGLVAATIVVVVFVDPLLGFWINGFEPAIVSIKTLLLLLSGTVSYVTVCTGFYLICRAQGSKAPIQQFLRAWGLAYLPTCMCAIAVSLAENFFYLLWGNELLGMLLNIVFVGILIWKALLYTEFLRTVAGLRGKPFWVAFVLCGALVLFLALMNMMVGLKTPIL